MTQRVLVTGATGFVGKALCETLSQSGYVVRAALRNQGGHLPAAVTERTTVGDIDGGTDWTAALRDVDLVLHVAARAHVLGDQAANAHLYTETNAYGTQRLAEAAAGSSVRRLVFMSSVKVNGEDSGTGSYSPDDIPHPCDAYAESKAMAERSLHAIAARTSLQVVCIRSPMVYGPGVRANFLRLMNWVDRERPLPLGAVCNRRSLVSIWNLCDLLVRALDHPLATNRTWMVSDTEDISTPDLIRRIGVAMSRRVRLLPVPAVMLRLGAVLVGRRAEVARLCGSLVVDVTRTRDELNWSARMSLEEGLARTVDWYLRESKSR